jgi:CheY-specific phosphatase CheX
MIEDAVRHLLFESARHALETMCFTAPDATSADPSRPPGELIASHLTFAGAPPGRFGAVVSAPVARNIAANFLGAEDDAAVRPEQVREVVGELTNMICGAVLSELESNVNFDLSAPAPVLVAETEPGPDYLEYPVTCRLEMPGGAIVLYLAFEEAA